MEKITIREILWDGLGNRIIKCTKLKNIDLIVIGLLFFIGWSLYWSLFMIYIPFTWRFIPDFIMGFFTCWIMFKVREYAHKKT